MNKDEFLIKLFLSKDKLVQDCKFQKEVINDLVKIGFCYANEHYLKSDSRLSNMMIQMSLLKVMSIVKLSEGEVFEEVKNLEIPIIDIQSISSIYRSLFENYCFFNHLYIQNWTKEEFLILENLWRISSLNQRISLLDKSPLLKKEEHFKKIESEKIDVVRMTNEIKQTTLYVKNKKTINNFIKNNKWQLTIESNKVRTISWKDLFNNTMKNHRKSDKIYQRFSLDAHPSYFSVFQFGELYTNRHDLTRISTVLFETIQLLCNYLNDFEKLIESVPEIEIESKYLIEILGKDTQ